MVYEPNGHKSGCIESITAGSYVIYDDEQWRVARTNDDYLEVYRKYETVQILSWDDVEPVPRPDGDDDDDPVIMTDGGVDVSEDSDDEAVNDFDPEDLKYIELRGGGDKRAKREWGGYSQDFDAAEHVHTYDEIVGHPTESWGVVDCADRDHMPRTLLIFDLDVYKLDDDFDLTRLGIPEDTLVTRSQRGGFHVYFAVANGHCGSWSESDFDVADDVPIDIRGSAVSAHVVAPSDIPGCHGAYDVVDDNPIKTVLEPEEACDRITLDGESVIKFDPHSRTDIDFDRPEEPPEDMPTCYHAGLSLRAAAPEEHPNTHKVNVLTALCGLAAGYDSDDVASHMCGEYAPEDDGRDVSDEEETAYQVQHLADKLDNGKYSPPALSTLQSHGILDEGEECGADCPVHGPVSEEVDWDAVEEARLNAVWRSDEMFDVRDDVIAEKWTDPPEDSDKEPEFLGVNVTEPIGPDDDVILTLPVQDARVEHRAPAQSTIDVKLPGRYAGRVINAEPLHKLAQRIDVLYNECLNAQTRAAAAHRLMQALEFVTTGGTDDQTIYCYNPVTGTLDGDGREVIRSVIEAVCPGRASGHEKREIVGKIADRTREDGSEAFDPRGKFADSDHDYRVVGNGILRLPTLQRDGTVSDPKLLDFSPDLRAKQRLPVNWNPDADTLEIDEWLDEITERPEDRATIEEAIGNILLPDYRHPKITMMYGSGRNSKGVILDVIVEMCGGVESPTVAGNRLEDLAQNQFRTAMLDEALVNVNGDIGQRKIKEGSKLKELTGGDAQEGESKHENSETFRNSAKLWFAANSPPLPPESGDAWQERWLPIHLPFKFLPDPDPEDPYQKPQENGIKDRLTRDDNLEAILVRAVEGLARLEAQGDVSLPESPEDRLDSYEQDADPIGRVETDLLKPVHGASSKAEKYVPNGAVFAAYKSLASDDGVDAVPRTDFFRLLEDRVEEMPFDKSRPRAPDSVDDDRVYSMKGVAFRDEAVDHLSEYWLNHPWVTLDASASDEDGEAVNDTSDRRSPHHNDVIALKDAGNADSYVSVEVEVDFKNLQGSNLIELTVHDESAMRDIIAKDRGNDELDIVDEVQEGDKVRFERLKPGADLKVRPMTDVTVVESGPNARDNVEDETSDDESGGSGRSVDLINDDAYTSNASSEDKVTNVEDAVKGVTDELESEYDAGVPAETAIETVLDRHDVTRDKVKHTAEKLKQQGELYEPMTGNWRST